MREKENKGILYSALRPGQLPEGQQSQFFWKDPNPVILNLTVSTNPQSVFGGL